jgi:hypothetical protein
MERILAVYGRQGVKELEEKFAAAVYWVKYYRRELKCWRICYDATDNPVFKEFAMRKLQVLGQLYTQYRLEAESMLHLLKEVKEAEHERAYQAY